MTHAPLLLIEDTPSLQLVYESVLKAAGYGVQIEGTAAGGMAAFRRMKPPIVVLDLMLPDRDGLDLMADILAMEPTTHVIVITSNGSINKAVAAMRAGAHDFLVKPFDEQRFVNVIENALPVARTGSGTNGHAVRSVPPPVGNFIGASPAMQKIYEKIASVSRSMATVFITGQSGTGKELCAQAIHASSGRASGPFIALNCGAIPVDLLESEVFGHLKGSFTGAISDKVGAAMAADGGTLFLDEVCELDLGLQTKLLRFLQTSMVTPVGATKPRKVNVRILCATNRDPMAAVRAGQFREDLYYRLHVIPIHMPALRERGSDVTEIARTCLARFAAEEGRVFTDLDPEVISLFQRLPWPGNVRQLLNVLWNVVVLNEGPRVTLSMLPSDILEAADMLNPQSKPLSTGTAQELLDSLAGRTLSEIEQLVIEETIRRNGGSVPRAARELDVSPSTLYRKREAWVRNGTLPPQG